MSSTRPGLERALSHNDQRSTLPVRHRQAVIEDAPAVQGVGVESPRGYRGIQSRQGFRRCLRQSVDQVEKGFQHLRRQHRASQGTEFRDIARVIHGSGTVRVGIGDGFFAADDPTIVQLIRRQENQRPFEGTSAYGLSA